MKKHRRWMLAARGMIVRLLHPRRDCLRVLFLDECRSGVSLTLRETPQRRDPAPSRWAYRLNRMWLTPA